MKAQKTVMEADKPAEDQEEDETKQEAEEEKKDDKGMTFDWNPRSHPIPVEREAYLQLDPANLSTHEGMRDDCRECAGVQLSGGGKDSNAASDETHEGCGRKEKGSSTEGRRAGVSDGQNAEENRSRPTVANGKTIAENRPTLAERA